MIIESVTLIQTQNYQHLMIMHLEIVFNLKEIQLPKSLEKIDFKKVFENCTEIKIEIEEENEYCKIEDDDVYCKK